jgi:hypothetical protein
MSILAGHERVGAEWLGKARIFRNAVAAEGLQLDAALTDATAKIRCRVSQRPSIRKEHLIDLRQAWNERIPHQFRLADQFEGDHKAFFLACHQLRGARWSADGWDEDEPGLLITLIALLFDRRQFEQRAIDLTLIGMHALARFYQRTFDHDQQSLLVNLRPLAFADTAQERVPCRDGTWCCEPVKAPNGEVVQRVQTFIGL